MGAFPMVRMRGVLRLVPVLADQGRQQAPVSIADEDLQLFSVGEPYGRSPKPCLDLECPCNVGFCPNFA